MHPTRAARLRGGGCCASSHSKDDIDAISVEVAPTKASSETPGHDTFNANAESVSMPGANVAATKTADASATTPSDEADLARLRSVLRGDPSASLRFHPRALKFFVSSTFTDTAAERDALIRKVYPKVRAHARTRRIAFEAAEMRWGIRAEAGDDNLAEAVCLRKLEECRRESGGLFFLSLWDDKYGFTPLPRGERGPNPNVAHQTCVANFLTRAACRMRRAPFTQSWVLHASTR